MTGLHEGKFYKREIELRKTDVIFEQTMMQAEEIEKD